jgi:hypothetical protein
MFEALFVKVWLFLFFFSLRFYKKAQNLRCYLLFNEKWQTKAENPAFIRFLALISDEKV